MTNQRKQKAEEVEDIVYDDIQGDSVVKKLRTRLKQCESEKHTYLDGWQRLKADTTNSKKKASDSELYAAEKAQEAILADLFPTLDSFDMAFKGDAWENVDEIWRAGVEQLHTQLLAILIKHGYQSYTEKGDIFDPLLHDAVATVIGGKEDTIAEVLRHGYMKNNRVVRAAQVTIYN